MMRASPSLTLALLLLEHPCPSRRRGEQRHPGHDHRRCGAHKGTDAAIAISSR